MRVDVLTLFPAAFTGPLDVSIIGRARATGLLDLHLHDIRGHATDRHRSVDDYPFGGGQGMVMRVDVLAAALEHVASLATEAPRVVYLTPQGRRLDDRLVRDLAASPRLALVCGRYEGVDERFVEGWVDDEVSVGDFIVTGGELPAMLLIDAVARHIPGALGDEASAADESFAAGLLEHPQYTRPPSFRGRDVPPVLLGGDHAAIGAWRHEQRLARTAARRPDLLEDGLSERASRKAAGVRIRTGRTEDIEGVLMLWKAAGPGIEIGPADTRAELERKLTRDPDLFLVAASGKRIAGAVIGGWDGRSGHVYHLAVEPGRRGTGIGSALMRELEVRLHLKGCRRMNLLVGEGGIGAVTFFEHLGWARQTATLLARDVGATP
jgi:tRNA (guanine37-N1)-methyltransferase